ncbi:MAG: hypothetical protein EAX95_11550 [Candidatus Thorarchaeota archaeon]|nr:hypothetical protein [Candidatus Thorarchaeota archaeon]
MILSGVSGAMDALVELSTHFGALFGPEFELTFEILMGILGGLTFLGGIGVVIGGLILVTRRFEVGRILIILCVGMAVLGLVMSLIQVVMSGTFMMPLASQLTQSLGWIGAIFSIVARTIAEQPGMVDSPVVRSSVKD